MKLTDREKITLVKMLVTCVIAIFALFYFASRANATESKERAVEKIDDIDGAKSSLYYFNATDKYLIYSKKSGTWLELSGSGLDYPDDNECTISANVTR